MAIKSAKQEINEIFNKLKGEEYQGLMFSLKAFPNFRKSSEDLSDNNYSVNASMFFVCALLDRLLDDLHRQGTNMQDLNLSVDSAWRSPAEQMKKFNEWQEKCKQDPALNPTQFTDPRRTNPTHSVGGAIDAVLYSYSHGFMTHANDLLKTSNHGEWIKDKSYQAAIKSLVFSHPHPKNGWTKELSMNIQQTSHVKLSKYGYMNWNAVQAVTNNRILNVLYSAMPMATPINNEYWHLQLRDYAAGDPNLGGKGGLPSFKLIFDEHFEIQDKQDIARKSEFILGLADKMKDNDIYYKTAMIPGKRIRFGMESKNDEPKMGSKERVLERIIALNERKFELYEQITADRVTEYQNRLNWAQNKYLSIRR